MKVSIGTFARSSLETRFGSDLAKVMREACIHYARRLRSGRRPRGVPSFHRVLEPSNGSTRVAFTLQSSIRSQLEGEARRQQVSMDEFLRHAALVYLADLDSAPGGDPDAQRFSALNSR